MLDIIKSDSTKTLNVLIYVYQAQAEVKSISFPDNPGLYEQGPWQAAMDRLMAERNWFEEVMPSQANLRRANVLNDLWCWMRRNRDEETANWEVHFVYLPERRNLQSVSYNLRNGLITSLEVVRK